MRRGLLAHFAANDDSVVIEAAGNARSAVAVIEPQVEKVVIANPKQARAIVQAKIKTESINAGVPGQLHANRSSGGDHG